jgi:outer membrane protein OmpA-like peptidoglycan-associated protein
MNSYLPSRRLAGGVIVMAALLAACATPTNPNLEAARQDYTRAAADPVVAAAAPRELANARDELQRGDAALRDRQKDEVVNHYAYLARQRVQVAIDAGRIANANQATADAQVQRDQIVIASRTAQANARTAQAQSQAAVANAQAAQAQADAAAERQRADDLANQLANAKQTDRGTVLTLGDVLFDTGRATLKPSAMRTIDEIATFLQAHPERRVLIEGYTDSTGSDATNRELSERRADAVRQALLARNVSFDRVQVHGLGEGYPVASNDTASGRQLNRRVEVVFSTPAGTFQSPRS